MTVAELVARLREPDIHVIRYGREWPVIDPDDLPLIIAALEFAESGPRLGALQLASRAYRAARAEFEGKP